MDMRIQEADGSGGLQQVLIYIFWSSPPSPFAQHANYLWLEWTFRSKSVWSSEKRTEYRVLGFVYDSGPYVQAQYMCSPKHAP